MAFGPKGGAEDDQVFGDRGVENYHRTHCAAGIAIRVLGRGTSRRAQTYLLHEPLVPDQRIDVFVTVLQSQTLNKVLEQQRRVPSWTAILRNRALRELL